MESDSDRCSSPSSSSTCAICLERLTNKSFTNSCLHMFCYTCLLNWSNVKPECPLCKKTFKSIIYNIRSIEDFDEYFIEPKEVPSDPPHQNTLNFEDYFAPGRRFFSYRTTNGPAFGQTASPVVHQGTFFPDDYVLPNVPPRRQRFGADQYSRRINRCDVYLRQLESTLPNIGRFRESSPLFFRENEAQIHRLVPWISRELGTLIQCGLNFNTHDALTKIISLLPMVSIQSDAFRRAVRQYLAQHTERFALELHTYACSPYDIFGFDREVIYKKNNQTASFIIRDIDGVEEVQIVPATSQQTNNEQNGQITDRSNTNYSFVGPLRNGITPTVISDSSNDSDDCIIIGTLNRHPEVIVLSDTETPTTSSYNAISSSSGNTIQSSLHGCSQSNLHTSLQNYLRTTLQNFVQSNLQNQGQSNLENRIQNALQNVLQSPLIIYPNNNSVLQRQLERMSNSHIIAQSPLQNHLQSHSCTNGVCPVFCRNNVSSSSCNLSTSFNNLSLPSNTPLFCHSTLAATAGSSKRKPQKRLTKRKRNRVRSSSSDSTSSSSSSDCSKHDSRSKRTSRKKHKLTRSHGKKKQVSRKKQTKFLDRLERSSSCDSCVTYSSDNSIVSIKSYSTIFTDSSRENWDESFTSPSKRKKIKKSEKRTHKTKAAKHSSSNKNSKTNYDFENDLLSVHCTPSRRKKTKEKHTNKTKCSKKKSKEDKRTKMRNKRSLTKSNRLNSCSNDNEELQPGPSTRPKSYVNYTYSSDSFSD